MEETGSSSERLSILEEVRAQYSSIGQLTYTLDDSWDINGETLTECLSSFCRRVPNRRRRLLDEINVWLSWDDDKLDKYTQMTIVFNFWDDEATREFSTARSFWQDVIENIERDLRERPL